MVRDEIFHKFLILHVDDVVRMWESIGIKGIRVKAGTRIDILICRDDQVIVQDLEDSLLKFIIPNDQYSSVCDFYS